MVEAPTHPPMHHNPPVRLSLVMRARKVAKLVGSSSSRSMGEVQASRAAMVSFHQVSLRRPPGPAGGRSRGGEKAQHEGSVRGLGGLVGLAGRRLGARHSGQGCT